jgi:hypothetical protein
MAYYRIIILLIFLSSCSANWHLKRAILKNPKLLDSTVKYVPYYKDTTIYRTLYIKGDTNTQETKKVIDSLQRVYNDSFTTVYQLVDSLGNLKTKVIRKPFAVHDTVNIVIKDTIEVSVPAQFKVESDYINWPLILGLIALILFFLLLHRYKNDRLHSKI